MLDNRIYTFLTLCELMNYRATAEKLSMTQPAVTQHIQGLEREYGCRLFIYKNSRLHKSKHAELLEKICLSSYYNEIAFRKSLGAPKSSHLKIGATKTIGDYVITQKLLELMKREDVALSVYIDNTQVLLKMLDKAAIDFAAIEGNFDKHTYYYRLMKKEEFVGVCAKNHPFSAKVVSLEETFNETLFLREKGSGTRDIFETILKENSYNISSFKRVNSISSFELIKKAVLSLGGITFAYKTLAESDKNLSIFRISKDKIFREFNYVCLKDSLAAGIVEQFSKQ